MLAASRGLIDRSPEGAQAGVIRSSYQSPRLPSVVGRTRETYGSRRDSRAPTVPVARESRLGLLPYAWRGGGFALTTPADEPIQPGSHVFTSDGTELGTVVRVEATTIIVKGGGMLGGEIEVPRSLVAEVEGSHIELSVTKDGLPSK